MALFAERAGTPACTDDSNHLEINCQKKKKNSCEQKLPWQKPQLCFLLRFLILTFDIFLVVLR